jgi:hypothetical protein
MPQGNIISGKISGLIATPVKRGVESGTNRAFDINYAYNLQYFDLHIFEGPYTLHRKKQLKRLGTEDGAFVLMWRLVPKSQ